MISFLFCEKFFSPVVNPLSPDSEDVTYNRKVFEIIMDISSKYGWSRWITKDAEQRLPTQLTMLQKNALMNLINSESSTHGVENLNGADPTSESAKNLSFKGHRVIVIVKSENDKELIHENPKIVPLTPSEFYAAWDELLVDKKKFLQLTGYADDSIFNTTLMVKRFFNGK